MDTTRIESMIAERCGETHAESDLHDLLAAVAEHQGRSAGAGDLANGSGFVLAYIEQVPYMLKVAWTAACNVGLEKEMDRILETVKSYWFQDDDIIPDHLGVIGLLDDAYCSLTSLQAVSDHYQLQSGKYLFPDDLTTANKVMRRIIGEPYATDLDRMVIQTLRDTGLIETMKTLASEEKKINFANQSTIWNHGPVSSLDLAQLGSLGLLED
jgi:uncharacterized membrane protein YkvA (DUF1232 family)